MSEKTNIAWCDSTVNFWSGCTKVSPGCAHCYAETLSKNKFFGGGTTIGKWGKSAPRQLHESAFTSAKRLNKRPFICDECGYGHFKNDTNICNNVVVEPDNETTRNCQCRTKHSRRIFSLSLGDWLDEEVLIEWLAWMLDTIRECSNVDFQLLTKRPENFEKRLGEVLWFERNRTGERDETENPEFAFGDWISNWLASNAPKNIWIGTSVENQACADERIPALLKIPATIRFLSCEPLLSRVDLHLNHELGAYQDGNNSPFRKVRADAIRWVIVGGESGKDARPCNVEWIRSLVRQGKAAGVATFIKQLGANPIFSVSDGDLEIVDGVPNIHDSKGGDMAEWPADLRVREFPNINAMAQSSKGSKERIIAS